MVPARGRLVVPTDLAIKLPPGTYGRVAPRSGLAVKHFIDTGAGVVDEDYRGPLGVVLFNHADTDFKGEQAGFLWTTSCLLACFLSCILAAHGICCVPGVDRHHRVDVTDSSCIGSQKQVGSTGCHPATSSAPSAGWCLGSGRQ